MRVLHRHLTKVMLLWSLDAGIELERPQWMQDKWKQTSSSESVICSLLRWKQI